MPKNTGGIISLELSHWDIIHIRSKAMQMMVAMAEDWAVRVAWSDQAKVEVAFWKDNIIAQNGMSLEKTIASGYVTYSDASGVAAAAIMS